MEAEALQLTVIKKLAGLMGEEAAVAVVKEVVAECGLSQIETPGDLLCIANVLTRRRGVLSAIGRSLKIQAIFLGAPDVG